MDKKMEYIPPSPGIDVNAPLVYMWEVRDFSGKVIGRYIGKASGGEKRPTKHYTRNVNKLLRREPYKKGKNYRRVHYALADAVITGHTISLSYLCNVAKDQDIFEVERRYIREYGCDADDGVGLNGPWKGAPRTLETATAEPEPACDLENAEGSLADLEDLAEYVKENYPELTIDGFGGRYSIWGTKTREKRSRILRAKQAAPAGKVWIKLAQTHLKNKDIKAAFAWDGTDSQLAKAIEGELALFLQEQKNRVRSFIQTEV